VKVPSLDKRKLKSGKHSWTVRYRENGRQRTYTIGSCDKRTAEKLFLQIKSLLAEGKSIDRKQEDKTLTQFISDYLKRCSQVKAPRTIIRERKVLQNFLDFAGNINIRSIRPLTMENYRMHRLDNGISPSTVNLEFRHLKVAFNTAVRWEFLDKNPLDNIHYIRVPQSEYPRYLTVEEIQKVRNAFRDTDFSELIDFYLATGTRLGEAISLKWDDIDFRRNQVVIRSVNAKGKKNRIISLRYSPGLKEMLKSMKRRNDDRVFGPFDKNGKELPQWSEWWVGRHISKILTSIGLPWATCHTFRHTFASHLVMAGVPIFTVQRLLGHAQIDTTMIYAHLAPEHNEEMMARLPYRIS
jgi:integrase